MNNAAYIAILFITALLGLTLWHVFVDVKEPVSASYVYCCEVHGMVQTGMLEEHVDPLEKDNVGDKGGAPNG